MKLENLKGLSSPILQILQELLHEKMSSCQVDDNLKLKSMWSTRRICPSEAGKTNMLGKNVFEFAKIDQRTTAKLIGNEKTWGLRLLSQIWRIRYLRKTADHINFTCLYFLVSIHVRNVGSSISNFPKPNTKNTDRQRAAEKTQNEIDVSLLLFVLLRLRLP